MKAFFGWMLIASALGFAKMIALAAVLTPSAFGNYAMAVGGAGLLTMILSFGLIEGTIKRFPRLFVEGRNAEIRGNVYVIGRHAGLRTAVCCAVSLAGVAVAGRADLAAPIALGVVLGGAGLFSRLASAAILATGDGPVLTTFTVSRSLTAFALALAGGWLWSWQGALGGEVAAAAITAAQGERLGRRLLGIGRDSTVKVATADAGLYVSAVLVAATLMADRAVVSFIAGSAVAGSYGFAMLVPQAGQVIINILGQRLGPGIIRSQRQRGALNLRSLLRAGIATLGASGVMMIAALVAAQLFPWIVLKYQIDTLTIVLACLVAASFFHVILEYALIAIDRERAVLAASVATFVAFAVSFAVSSTLKHFLIAALVTRATQTLWLIGALYFRPSNRDLQ